MLQATPHPAVVFMPEGSRTHMGGTMRLGSRRTLLQTVDCTTAKLYQVGVNVAATNTPGGTATPRFACCMSCSWVILQSFAGLQWYLTLQLSLIVQREEYIDERHRHRYEVNPDLVDQLEQHGLRFVGKDETVRICISCVHYGNWHCGHLMQHGTGSGHWPLLRSSTGFL